MGMAIVDINKKPEPVKMINEVDSRLIEDILNVK